MKTSKSGSEEDNAKQKEQRSFRILRWWLHRLPRRLKDGGSQLWQNTKASLVKPGKVIQILGLVTLIVYTYETRRTNQLTQVALNQAAENNTSSSQKTDQLISETHTLADNAGKQVERLESLVVANRDSAEAANAAAQTAAAALGSEQQRFQLDQRPWVGATVHITEQTMNPPPYISYNISMDISLNNYGKSTASNVGWDTDQIFFNIPNHLQWESSHVCEGADRRSANLTVSEVIFPGDKISKTQFISFRMEPASFSDRVGTAGKMLVICVAYQWGEPTTTYHTRMVYLGEEKRTASEPTPCPGVPSLLCRLLNEFREFHVDTW